MGENLWADLSEWMVDTITASMGVDSEWETLKVQKVELAVAWDELEWGKWPKPAVVVIGSRIVYGSGPHGDGDAHFDKTYPFVWLVLTEGVQSQAVLDAQTLLKRMERLAADLIVENDLEPDVEGETLANIHVRAADMTAVARPSSKSHWMVIGGLRIDFESET